MLMKILFWLALLVSVYIYLGYPLVLWILDKFRRKQWKTDEQLQPVVTFIISAFNEEQVIARKLDNTLQIDYPREKLEILVVSDASTDQTDEIVRSYADKGVRLLRMPERHGKTYGLNHAVQQARGEILIFSDANAMYHPHAVRELVKYFADPEVGYVVGKAEYYENLDKLAGKQENLYWRYELMLKEFESRVHSVVGGDGAIYAIRRELYEPLSADDINDFVNPLQIIAKGYRGVFAPEAVCYEDAAGDFDKEFYRKKRIVNRSWRGFWKVRQVMNPRRTGIFAWEILSHKVLRWYWWAFALLLLVSNMFLLQEGWFYRIVFLLQIVFYGMALVGWWNVRQKKELPSWFLIPFYFIEVHVASLIGLLESFSGKKYQTWNTART